MHVRLPPRGAQRHIWNLDNFGTRSCSDLSEQTLADVGVHRLLLCEALVVHGRTEHCNESRVLGNSKLSGCSETIETSPGHLANVGPHGLLPRMALLLQQLQHGLGQAYLRPRCSTAGPEQTQAGRVQREMKCKESPRLLHGTRIAAHVRLPSAGASADETSTKPAARRHAARRPAACSCREALMPIYKCLSTGYRI